jgi:hypothetical protein
MEPQEDYLPESLPGRLVDYETATVITQMIEPPRPVLVVNGEKDRPGTEVRLVPVTYVRQPEFWEIQVVGSPGELGGPPVATQLPAEPPTATQLPAESTAYSIELDLAGCTGTVGIEVVGANQTERILVAGTPTDEE